MLFLFAKYFTCALIRSWPVCARVDLPSSSMVMLTCGGLLYAPLTLVHVSLHSSGLHTQSSVRWMHAHGDGTGMETEKHHLFQVGVGWFLLFLQISDSFHQLSSPADTLSVYWDYGLSLLKVRVFNCFCSFRKALQLQAKLSSCLNFIFKLWTFSRQLHSKWLTEVHNLSANQAANRGLASAFAGLRKPDLTTLTTQSSFQTTASLNTINSISKPYTDIELKWDKNCPKTVHYSRSQLADRTNSYQRHKC